MRRIILHIDVNNAFLSWTAIDLLNNGYKYDIRDSYAVISGDPKRRAGIVLAKSMSCKKLGIVTGETLYAARKKCNVLKSYPPNYRLYQTMSKKFFEFLKNYTPDIEAVSVDECFIDYTKVKNIYGSELEFAKMIKDQIEKTLGFTINIGIANNKLCAKMASDFEKPNKIHTLYDSEIESKLWTLKVEKLYGVGKKSWPVLHKLGIFTIGDLAHANIKEIRPFFKNQAEKLIEKANGIDLSEVDSRDHEAKCISSSKTLEYDYFDKNEIYYEIDEIANKLGMQLRKKGLYAGVIAIIIKDQFFRGATHQITLKNETNITDEIKSISKNLFDKLWNQQGIRLIGIRLDKLSSEVNYQMSLFEPIENREKIVKLDNALDHINEKYGINAIRRGIN